MPPKKYTKEELKQMLEDANKEEEQAKETPTETVAIVDDKTQALILFIAKKIPWIVALSIVNALMVFGIYIMWVML